MSNNNTSINLSLATELKSKMDRLEKLIDGRHMPSEGDYYESLIKEHFRNTLPKSMSVSTGFIISKLPQPNNIKLISSQLDIIIWDSHNYSPFFADGDFVVIAPEACIGVIEITKSLSKNKIKQDLEKIDSALKFQQLTTPNSRNFFTAILSIKTKTKTLKTTIQHIKDFYQENIDNYLIKENVKLKRKAYVDIVANLDSFLIETTCHPSITNPQVHTMEAYELDNFEACFNMFDIKSSQRINTKNNPSSYNQSHPTYLKLKPLDGYRVKHWTIIKNKSTPPSNEDLSIINYIRPGNKTAYIKTYI